MKLVSKLLVASVLCIGSTSVIMPLTTKMYKTTNLKDTWSYIIRTYHENPDVKENKPAAAMSSPRKTFKQNTSLILEPNKFYEIVISKNRTGADEAFAAIRIYVNPDDMKELGDPSKAIVLTGTGNKKFEIMSPDTIDVSKIKVKNKSKQTIKALSLVADKNDPIGWAVINAGKTEQLSVPNKKDFIIKIVNAANNTELTSKSYTKSKISSLKIKGFTYP